MTASDTGDGDDLIDDAERALADSRQRLAEVPATVLVANHAIGLYEVAAIHLSTAQPDLQQASLAIDALGGLLDAVGARLGDESETLVQALTTLRMAYVSVARGTAES